MNIEGIKNNHINQILFHSMIWCFFIVASLIQFYESPFSIGIDFYVQWTTGILLFYVNYLYLVPLLLLQKKYWQYFTIVIALITLFMIVRFNFFMPEFQNMRPFRMINSSGKEILLNPNFKSKQPFFFKIAPSFFYLLVPLLKLCLSYTTISKTS